MSNQTSSRNSDGSPPAGAVNIGGAWFFLEHGVVTCHTNDVIQIKGIWTFHSSALSFPGAKTPQMELSFPGTLAPVKRKVQKLSIHRTYAHTELSLLRSECPKNFLSLELSLPYFKKWGKALQQYVRRCILAMVVGLRAHTEMFNLQMAQYIVDDVDLVRCVKL